MGKETTIQNQLKQALDETRLSNEIISAIAKSYCSIYRIDVQKDFFEEVSNDSEIHKLTGNRGCATEKLYQLCDTMVAPEYRPLIRPFLDISTLSERLKTEECISTEYRMCDGSWHRMLFIVKKRDESGNVTTHLLLMQIPSVYMETASHSPGYSLVRQPLQLTRRLWIG